MRRLAGYVDFSDVLYLLGAVCIAVPIYVFWAVWVWAYVGVVLILWGALQDIGRVERERNGPRR